MFKKTLLAAALAAATFGANAATVITTSTPGAEVISNQGLPATGAFTLVDGVIFTLKGTDDTGIVDNGRLVVSITGGFFVDPANALATVNSPGAGTLSTETVLVDVAASTSTKLVFDLANNGGDWAIIDGDTITITANTIDLQISGTEVKMSSVFQGATDVDVASTTAPAASVAKVGDQWVAGVVADLTAPTPASGALDALINVADSRETFVFPGDADSTTTDTLTFDVNTVGTGATINDVTVTVAGDFTNVLSVVADNAGNFVTYAINEAMTEAKYVYTGATATTVTELTTDNSELLFTLVTATDDVTSMAVSEFNVSIDVDYNDAEAVQGDFSPLTAAAAGGWELNGSSSTLEYVPFGPNTALILQATSTFDEDASVSVSYLNPTTGLMVNLEDIATATANSVSRLGPTVMAAIIADSGLASGKTRMVVTINAPDANLSLFTGFKDTSDKDRLALPQTP
ncbi:MAG: hypothetical protein ACJAXJ_003024 [Colwellia sp.]|jgi:hypothetical protein